MTQTGAPGGPANAGYTGHHHAVSGRTGPLLQPSGTL